MSDANTTLAMQVQAPISIKAETALADPDTCKFTVSSIVQAGGPFFFADTVQAASAPLAVTLFELPGVASVLIADNIVTVSKSANAEWQTLKAAIGAAIRAQLLSGAPAVLATAVAAQAQAAQLRSFVRSFKTFLIAKSIVRLPVTVARSRLSICERVSSTCA